MIRYYASLTGPLLGLYLPLPIRPDVEKQDACDLGALLLNNSKMARLWCSIYEQGYAAELVGRFGGLLLPNEHAARLLVDVDGDVGGVIQALASGALYEQVELVRG